MASTLGRAFDSLSCRIAGHLWVQHFDAEPDGVMVCARCSLRDESGLARRRGRRSRAQPAAATESIVPEHRPWLDPPYMASPE